MPAGQNVVQTAVSVQICFLSVGEFEEILSRTSPAEPPRVFDLLSATSPRTRQIRYDARVADAPSDCENEDARPAVSPPFLVGEEGDHRTPRHADRNPRD